MIILKIILLYLIVGSFVVYFKRDYVSWAVDTVMEEKEEEQIDISRRRVEIIAIIMFTVLWYKLIGK